MSQATRHRVRLDIEALEDRAVPAAIGGNVYWDQNSNATLDAGEPGIPNTSVSLFDSTGALVASQNADSAGYYRFAINPNISTAPTTQEVDAVFSSAATDQSRTQTVAQFNPTLGTLTSIDIVATGDVTNDSQVENIGPTATQATVNIKGSIAIQGPDNLSMTGAPTGQLQANLPGYTGTSAPDLTGPSSTDFGPQTYSATLGSTTLTGSDMNAFMGTGTVNFAEQATATACACGSGNMLSMLRTAADATVKVVYHYTPSNALKPGQYTVVEKTPANYAADTPTSLTVNLGTTDSLNNNFGNVQLSSLAGTVYADTDHTGTLTANDQMLGGVTVTLSGTTLTGTPVSSTLTTNASGQYGFNNLAPGNYTITQSTPADYQTTAVNVGTAGGTTGANSVTLQLTQGVQGQGYNFGNMLPAAPQDTTTPSPTPTPTPTPTVTPTPTPAPDTSTETPSKFFYIGSDWNGWGW